MKIKLDERAGTLTITIPLQEPKKSRSGKTRIIATESGETTARYEGKSVFVSVNAYVKY